MSSTDILGSDLWQMHNTDCIPHMLEEMPAESVDMAVMSVPFPSLYSYTSSESDIGNSEDLSGDGKLHLSWFYRGLRRVLKPGRVAIIHVMQIPRMKRSGGVGLFDFRGLNARLGERAGLVFEYDWMTRKNPQSQAIRTRSRELQFAGLEADRARTRGTLNDYLLKFRAPGENEVPIVSENEVSRNDWIKWAEGCWDDIVETDTLNTAEAKSEDDTRHICPMNLESIRRCVLLFSNPGEIVFSPFAGIGSEGYVALGGKSPKTGRRIERPRRFYGTELKVEYYQQAQRNLSYAVAAQQSERSSSLFAEMLD